MTINVALVTSDAVILGCDSTASRSQWYIDPFEIGLGAPGPDGKFSVNFDFSQMQQLVTDAWGGVTKMFPLASVGDCHVAAVTAGLANLNQRSMASLATEFRVKLAQKKPGTKKYSVREVADKFLEFMRAQFNAHYAGSPLPEDYREGPEFLVGGVSSKDTFPSCYRVLVKEEEVIEAVPAGSSGVSWNGQSDAVERIIRGYDRKLRNRIDQTFDKAISTYQGEMNAALLRIVDEILIKLNATMPDGVDTTLPSSVAVTREWDEFRAAIQYGAFTVQEAVHFVEYLIMMQSGKSRFASGIATVGGRIRVGVVTHDGFKKLNEPELTHKHTGFSDD